jgi:hypothetical protein
MGAGLYGCCTPAADDDEGGFGGVVPPVGAVPVAACLPRSMARLTSRNISLSTKGYSLSHMPDWGRYTSRTTCRAGQRGQERGRQGWQ